MGQYSPPNLGEMCALAISHKKRDLKFVFKVSHGVAQRRLRDVQRPCSSGERTFIGNRDERQQVMNPHMRIIDCMYLIHLFDSYKQIWLGFPASGGHTHAECNR